MSHLDSNTLHTAPATAGPDGIPALAVSNNAGGLTTDDVVSPASNNPFLAQNGGEVVSPPLSASSQPPTAASLDSLSGANSSSAPFSANSHSSDLSGSSGPQSATSNLSQSSKDTASSAADKANNASAQAKDTANTAAAKAKDVANNASAQAKDVANNASAQAKSTANAASDKANDIATGLRQRVNNLPSLDEVSHNPTVQNVKGAAGKQVGQLREQLGRSKFIRDLEKRTNIDRVYLVVGGILAYFLVIPLNLFGLALPTTTLLTLLPPAFLALGILEDKQSSEAGEAATRALLSYFVTLGFIQFAESLMAGFLERKIPQYYTVKLLFLAYLLHPKTQGAMKIHQNVFRPILVTSTRSHKTPFNTPPQTQSASSPTTNLSNTGVQKSFNAAGPDVGAFNSGGPGYAVDR